MSILKVARMGHPVLRRKARAIERTEIRNPVVQKLIDDMIETMVEYHGVGLAAPQVHEGLRLFVAIARPATMTASRPSTPIAIINPEITPVGSEIVEDWEGCLSIPDIRGRVPRAARDLACAPAIGTASASSCAPDDYSARVIQHETDHLDGILFFDRMRSFESLTFLDEYSRYWVKD